MITCVTAPSRSGTSLTMQMLQAAGFPLFWNVLPNRSEFNPFGHYEIDWRTGTLEDCEGKAVKVMPFDLHRLTPDHKYQFITIVRNVACAEASEHAARVHRGSPMEDADKVEYWQHFTFDYIRFHKHVIVGFSELFSGVAQLKIAEMLGFNELQIAKMNDCVEPSLWHFKSGETHADGPS